MHRHAPPARGRAAVAAKAAAGGAAPAAPAARQVWRITKQGALADLRLEDEAMPELQPGQALVEVKAVGLNFADVFCCLGLYKAAPKGAFVPGLEFSGVVLAVHPEASPQQRRQQQQQQQQRQQEGDGQQEGEEGALHQEQQQRRAPRRCAPLRPGDRVIGVTRFGAFTTHAALDTRYLRPIPEGWSFEEGAAFAVQTLTAAYGLLTLGDLKGAARRRAAAAAAVAAAAGDGGDSGGGGRRHADARPVVLLQSAAGGVGLQAVEICRAAGARVLGLVGSERKAAALEGIAAEREGLLRRRAAAGAGAAAGGAAAAAAAVDARGGGGAGGGGAAFLEVLPRARGEAAARAQLAGYLERHRIEGFDIFLDSAAGDYLRPGFDALAPTGRYVVFGAGALTPPPGASLARDLRLLWPPNLLAAARLLFAWATRPKLDVLNLPGQNKAALGFNLIWLYERVDDILSDLFDEIEDLDLPPPHVGARVPWAQLPAALGALQGGGTVGKVVVTLGGDG